MAPVFCRDFGLWRGLWMALFHSVSAFCNAGIDLMGVREPFSSLTSYAADPVINVAIMLLIVVGGIGFLTWDDIRTNRLHVRRYRMQSKVILATTALLICCRPRISSSWSFRTFRPASACWRPFSSRSRPRTGASTRWTSPP